MESPDRQEDEVVWESDTHKVLASFCDTVRKRDGITREDIDMALQATASHPMNNRYVIVMGGVRTDWGDSPEYMRIKLQAYEQSGLWSWGVLIERKNDSLKESS